MKKTRAYIACALGLSMVLGGIEPMAAAMADVTATQNYASGLKKASPSYANAKEEIADEKENKFKDDTNLDFEDATPSDATPANAFSLRENSMGDIWDSWSGKASFVFLSGTQGEGSEEKPYLIKNKEQLMGLSELTAMGMSLESGNYVGNYENAYFALAANIDLQGIDWIPIGFYQDSSEADAAVSNVFTGHFDGRNYTIKNLKLNTFSGYNSVGLFGTIKDAEIKNLIITPDSGYSITGKSKVGILAGSAEDSTIKDITIKNASVAASGIAGGAVGEVSNTLVENISCENVKINVQSSTDTIYVGGIAGQAMASLIVDCKVTTGNNESARIQGKGYIGGIAGSQNSTDIYNVYVSGTIGGKDSVAIGGITGEYIAGKLKVARFEGTIANSYMASPKEGTFIGTRKGAATNFRYIDDIAYLFADSQAKIVANVCGSGISDDNDYTYEAKIGYNHSDNNYYTLVQGKNGNSQVQNQYFYEALEEGILDILDKENLGGVTIDHIAPNATGKPARGYLVVAEQIDTIAGEYYSDVASMNVQGSSQYCKPIDKEHRGAIAYGDNVYVTTVPNNTETEKYEMDGVPFYKNAAGAKKSTTYDGASKSYTFKMPGEDIALSALYKKVAVSIKVEPSTYNFVVTQTRTGNRKNPTRTTIVKNAEGQLIASYVNGNLEQGTQVQPITIKATIDTNNDVTDSKVKWSIDDIDLITLARNADEEYDGYTNQSASLTLNMAAQFFSGIISRLEKEQEDSNYANKIPNTIYGAGHQSGGIGILTAQTRPAASFEGKPCTANSRINVTFQVLDNTYVANEDAALDKPFLEFVVTRTLEGERKAQTDTITVTAPQTLTATFTPDFFSKQDVTWVNGDTAVMSVSQDTVAYKDALVIANKDAKWIKDIMVIDDSIRANDAEAVLTGTGQKSATVTVIADDKLGNRNTAGCEVTITFKTEDKTYVKKPSTGGGNSSSGGGSSAVRSGGTKKETGAPAGAVTGTWVQDATGNWLFTGNGRTYTNEWAYIHNPYATGQATANWFKFDDKGYMVTGWYTDAAGNTYFLHNIPDGSQGRMYLGWNWIAGKCYYFNEISDGTRGKLLKSTITPDGYKVNTNGEWIVDEVVKGN